MDLAGAAIRNRTTTLSLVFVVALGGVIAFNTLARLEDPEFTIKDAKVITLYPGATARQVEEEVTDRLEKAVQQMGQLKRVTSKSKPGLSILTVTIKDEFGAAQLPQVWDELRRKVGDVQHELPPGASSSIVNDDFGAVYGVFFAVYGDGFSYRELKEHVDKLERELLLVPNVAKVAVFADQSEAIYVEMSRARMARLGISEAQIFATLGGRNLVVPSGQVQVGPEYIRIDPQPASVEAIGNTLIQGLASSHQIYLRDVADIWRGYQDPPQKTLRFDGRPAIGVGISTGKGGNVVDMGHAVANRLRELEAETPVGIETGIIYWQSKYVTLAIDSFVVSLLQALAIVIGILLFAMGLRSGLLIGIILLLTVLATFVPMKAQGIALERISLGALIIALGMLVDNAIVVVEGIQIRMEAGKDPVQSAIEVVKGAFWPLLGGTFVAILAFGALGFSTDNTGEFCRSLFIVITISLLISWLLAVTVTPQLAVLMLKGKKEGATGGDDPYGGRVFRGYRGLLRTLLRRRVLTLGVLVLLLAVALKGFGFVQQSFFPDSTTPQFTLDYWLPQGAYTGETEKAMADVEEYMLGSERVGRDTRLDPPTDERPWQPGIPEIQGVAATVGGGALRFLLTYAPEEPNSAYGQFIVEIEDYRRIPSLVRQIEGWIQEHHPQALAFGRPFVLGPGGGSKIEARFRGPDPEELRRISAQAKRIMAADSGARDVRDDWRESVKVIRPAINETATARVGLARSDVAEASLRTFDGHQVGVYREGDKLIPIVSRAPRSERDDVENLYDLQVWSRIAGGTVPVANLVTGTPAFPVEFEDAIIGRRNRMPTIIPQCNQASGNASVLFARLRPQIEAISLPTGYSMEWGGEYENSKNGQAGLMLTFPLMILLMVMIVIVQFNSLRLPAIIWLTVPLAIIGVTAGLLLAGQPFGFMALLGALSLIGMLVKNSIVLVDEIRLQNKDGKELYDAILDASASRLRPVAMAALTTVLGMIPLLPDAFFVSMAVTIMAGLTFATVLTLVVVPVLYGTFFFVREPKEEG